MWCRRISRIRGPDRIIVIVEQVSSRESSGGDCRPFRIKWKRARRIRSGDGQEVSPEGIPIHGTGHIFNFFVRTLPDRESAREKCTSFVGEKEDAAAAIARILLNFDEATAFQRLQRCSQSGSIHGKQGSDGPHWWRFRSIERHEERELTVGEFERSQFLIKAPSQGACRTLHVETETPVFHQERCLIGQRFCT